MLHFEQTIDCPADRFAAFGIPAQQILFFDIETTGFSPESSYVYLIGCAFLRDGVVKLRQWFLDDLSEEKQLVQEFGTFSKNFCLLVHYNGSTFDLPYLQKKAHRHRLLNTYFYGAAANSPQNEGFRQQSLDLYRSLLPCKKFLGLRDLKQKTVEQFLGISRKDVFSGGDLIPVYTEFLGRYRYECLTHGNPFQDANHKQTNAASQTDTVFCPAPDFGDTGLTKMPESPAKALLYVLLLHNCEDITGLLAISALLCLPRLLEGAFTVTELSSDSADSAEPYATTQPPCKILRLDAGLDSSLFSSCFAAETVKQLPEGTFTTAGSPTAVSLSMADAPGCLLLSVPVLSGTFKYFFEDYKEYYYLPMEDCAMHKSVAQFVEKEYRRKATKETCYQKKEGFFLPQPEEIVTPAFRLHAKDRFSYFENTKNAFTNPALLKSWTRSLLTWLLEQA